MGRTPNFNFATFNHGNQRDFPGGDSWKFSDEDRFNLDAILHAIVNHRHDGVAESPIAVPTPELELIVGAEGGILEADTTYYYKITLVDPSGLETAASAEAFVSTPARVIDPSSPGGITFQSTGGFLIPGPYYYKVSAYVGETTIETAPSAVPAQQVIPGGSSTNQITFTFPSLPAGATGWNVYRRKPGGDGYGFLESVIGSETTYTDDGTVDDECTRRPPQQNQTNRNNAIIVSFPGATPETPAGYTWRIYRTTSPANYQQSRVAWVVEETFENSGIIVPEYTDLGRNAEYGAPPEAQIIIPHPDPVSLTDAIEVTGTLPAGHADHIHVHTFQLPGIVTSGDTADFPFMWPFPDRGGRIVGAVAWLQEGSVPAVDDVIVDVTINGVTIYAGPGDLPTIPQGDQASAFAYANGAAGPVFGDIINVLVDQDGGGATPTDEYLTVCLIFAYRPGYTDAVLTEL